MWSIVTGPTRQAHERLGLLSVIVAGTGTTPSSFAAPLSPGSTSGRPSPQAPRRWGAHSRHRSGSETSAQACAGLAWEKAE